MSLVVEEIKDEAILRRWMLRPSFVKKILDGAPISEAQLESAFAATMSSSARFFLVSKDGQEKGVIIFKPSKSGWDMHLCLSTWFSDTREAVNKAMLWVAGEHTPISATYPYSRRSVHVLLNDLGFGKLKPVGGGFVTRQFIAVDTNTRCVPS